MLRIFKKYPLSILILKISYTLTEVLSKFYSTFKFKFKLMLIGAVYGNGMQVDGKILVRALKKGKLIIGKNFTLHSRPGSALGGITNYPCFMMIKDGSIEIGDNCGFTGTVLSARTKIKIGNNVLIGANTRIFDHDYHSMNYRDRRDIQKDLEGTKSIPVTIGDDVFIGNQCQILKGVKIGSRCIISANSVVSLRNIPDDSVVAGNPAKIYGQMRE